MAEKKKKTASKEASEKTTKEKVLEETDIKDETIENSDADKSETKEKSELDIANEKIDSLSDKLMRTAAEFDNFKKRTVRDKEDIYKSSVCDTINALLPVLDNLERAITAAEASENNDGILDGVKMIKKQFDDALSSIGVLPIEAVGNQFDPEKHNAVMMADSDEDTNTVLEEFQKGYIYKEKVVRHSMVKVSN